MDYKTCLWIKNNARLYMAWENWSRIKIHFTIATIMPIHYIRIIDGQICFYKIVIADTVKHEEAKPRL